MHPNNYHPDSKKNIEKLQTEGYRVPAIDELPSHLQFLTAVVLINKEGDTKVVNLGTGKIQDMTAEKQLPSYKKPKTHGM